MKRIETAFYNNRGWPAKRLDLKDARSAICSVARFRHGLLPQTTFAHYTSRRLVAL